MKASTSHGAGRPLRPRNRTLVTGLVLSLLALLTAFPVRTLAQQTPLDPPDIGCQVYFSDAIILSVCGGGWGGAPNGFVIQWQKETDRVQYGWPDNGATPSPSFCEATFTGPEYHLMMGQCVNIQFGKNPFDQPGVASSCTTGAPLMCNTEYVFRSKALAGMNMTESGWIGDLRCSTDYSCTNQAPDLNPTPLDPPDIGCQAFFSDAIILSVCGGGWGGAPNGFVIQWQTQANRVQYGWPDDGATPSPSFCEATFTGTQYELQMGQCISLQFGKNPFNQPGIASTCTNADPLQCNTEYVFRSKALAGMHMTESPWIGDLRCSTDYFCNNPGPVVGGQDLGCTLTQSYWRSHPTAWPVTTLTLGNVSYTQRQLLQILWRPGRGNGLCMLARQLIAAKLNVASGASGATVAQTIADSDAMIGDLVVPPCGNGFLAPAATDDYTASLTSYNEGTTGPGHCD